MNLADLHAALYEQAYEMACQRATEEGDVDIDYDYPLMDAWTEEYYREMCKEEGIEPSEDYI